MWTLRAAYFLIALMTVSSQKYPHRQSNDLSTEERFLNDVHVVTREIRESASLQKKAMVDAVSAANRAGFGVLGDLQKSSSGVMNTFVNIELAKLEAIKAARLVLLNMLASQISSLTEEVENEDIFDLLDSPLFGRLVNLLLPLLFDGDSRSLKTATDSVRTQRDPKTAAGREYSSRDSTPSMQRPSSPTTLFPLSYVSALRSARKVSKL